MTPPLSITHSLQPQEAQHTNLIHTTQHIEATIANHQPKNFSNIKELTGLNILPPSKLSDRMVTPKNTKAPENPNTNNQHKSKPRKKPNQNEWEIQRTPTFRTQTVQKEMVQTKLVKTMDKDKNLSFGNIPSRRNPKVTRLLFINTNGLELGTDAHSLNELCSNRNSQEFTHWKNKHTKDKF